MVRQRLQALTAALLLLAACKKEPVPPPTVPADERRVYVLCEGSLGQATAALSVYLPARDSVFVDAFGDANSPQWGDVAQSLLFTTDEIFICVNNSDKIFVADRATFRLKHTIAVRKPRYIQPINDSVAMVSTLFGNTLFRVSLKSYAVTDSLKLPRKNPEGMVIQHGLLYVCPWDTTANKVYVVEDGRRVIDSISIGEAPHTIELDKDGRAWVLSGNVYAGKRAKLTQVDLNARSALTTLSFPASADPLRLSFNAARDTLYYIGVNYTGGTGYNGIFRMAINSPSLPVTPFIAAQSKQYFWSIGIDPHTGLVYVGDPKGFTQKGSVLQYTPQGTLVKQFSVGVGPGHFYFD